jgi:uncharacterized protein YqgV (UPF0045/DUF77 family)
MKKIIVKVEKTTTGFSAYAEKYPAFTTGRSSAELISNMVDSINTYFEAENVKRKVTPRDLTFEVQISSVFEVFPINVKALSKRIGMNYTLLSQYANGKKSPSQKQTEKIVTGIHEIGRELTEINLV